MKVIVNISILLLIVLQSCSKTNLLENKDYSLVGTWKIDSIQYLESPTYFPELDTFGNKAGDQMILKIKEKELEFIHQGSPEQGVYNYVFSNNAITLYGHGAYTSKLYIEQGESAMTLMRKNSNDLITSKMYAKRI